MLVYGSIILKFQCLYILSVAAYVNQLEWAKNIFSYPGRTWKREAGRLIISDSTLHVLCLIKQVVLPVSK